MLCDTSWPYAPTFCTGVAPVGPGDAGQRLDPGQLLLDRVPDHVVPRRPRGDRERGTGARRRVGHLDAAAHVAHDDPVEARVGDQEVRAAPEHQQRLAVGVGRADRVEQLGLGRRLDVPPRRTADAQRREVREGGRGGGPGRPGDRRGTVAGEQSAVLSSVCTRSG